MINISTAVEGGIARASEALGDFLNWDDARIAAEAESLRFPEFENIEVTSRSRF